MYHVEDVEEYNKEEMRHLYIDCHHLLHQYLFLSLNLSVLIYDLKMKWNTKERRRKEHLHYTKR